MSDDELRAKFESLAGPVIGEKKAAALADAAMNVEKIANIADLMKLTALR
jgi:hypothetical protein